MPQYQRILVKYRLPHSDKWSDFHWCDITRNGENSTLQVKVALAIQGANMPRDEEFRLLDDESAKKLLVMDCSKIPAIRYYLICHSANLHRFSLKEKKGYHWISGEEFNKNIKYDSNHLFSLNEIQADTRLSSSADHVKPLSCADELIYNLRTQYDQWAQTREAHIEQVSVLQEDQSRKEEKREETVESETLKQTWNKESRWLPIQIKLDAVENSPLEINDRLYIHYKICEDLTTLKSKTLTQAEYQSVLFTLLTQPLSFDQFSPDLHAEIRLFRDSFLRKSDALDEAFMQEGSTKPSLFLVCNYVLELVLIELIKLDPEYRDFRLDDFNISWPGSFQHTQLGMGRTERLIDDDAPPFFDGQFFDEQFDDRQFDDRQFEDEELAYQAQIAELNSGLNQAREANSRAFLGSQSPLQSEEAAVTNLRRNSLFSSSAAVAPPPNLNSGYRILLLIAGGGLCAFGAYVAFSSFFTGVALMAAGYLCLVLSSALATNQEPDLEHRPPVGAFGYPMGGRR